MNDKWSSILQSFRASPKGIRVFLAKLGAADAALERFGVGADTTLGTVLRGCGGIVIDDWLRIYGTGLYDICEKNDAYAVGADRTVVAEDAAGGFFVLRGDAADGSVEYFAPDALEYEDTEMSYAQFLFWAVQGDTDGYYADFRWDGWREETAKLAPDEGIHFYPPLCAKADSIDARSRRAVPMTEIIAAELELKKRLDGGK